MLRVLRVAIVLIFLAGCGSRSSPPQGEPASGGTNNTGADARTTLRTLLLKANDFEDQQKQTASRLRQISGEIDALTLHLKRNGVATGADLAAKPEQRRWADQLMRLADEFDHLVRRKHRVDDLLNDIDEVVNHLEGEDSDKSLGGHEQERLTLLLARIESAAADPSGRKEDGIDPIRLDAVLKQALSGESNPYNVPDRSRRVIRLVDARAMVKEYHRDSALADLKYKDKVIQVRGRLTFVYANTSHDGKLHVEGTKWGESPHMVLYFTVPQKRVPSLRGLKKDDEIVLRAVCEGYKHDNLFFVNAEVVSTANGQIKISPHAGKLSGPNTAAVGKSASNILHIHKQPVVRLAFSLDGDELVCVGVGKENVEARINSVEILVLNAKTKQVIASVDRYCGDRGMAAAISRDGGRVLYGGSYSASMTPSRGSSYLDLEGHKGGTYALALSPVERKAASSGDDCAVRLWDIDNSRKSGFVTRAVELGTLRGHKDLVRALCFSPDGGKLLSGGEDGRVIAWTLKDKRQEFTADGHTAAVLDLCFLPGGMMFVSSSKDKSIRWWAAESGKLIATLLGHSDWVTCVAAAPDGRLLASGSKDGEIAFWDAESKTRIRVEKGHSESVRCLVFSPDGKTLYSGGEDKTVRWWIVPPQRSDMQ